MLSAGEWDWLYGATVLWASTRFTGSVRQHDRLPNPSGSPNTDSCQIPRHRYSYRLCWLPATFIPERRANLLLDLNSLTVFHSKSGAMVTITRRQIRRFAESSNGVLAELLRVAGHPG